MYDIFNHPEDKMKIEQEDDFFQQTDEIFKAFVDTIIPRTPGLAEEFGKVQYYGALDLYTDEYMILTLNSYYYPIAIPTAEIIEAAAELLVFAEANDRAEFMEPTEMSIFGSLAPIDQLRALTLLQQMKVNPADLPIPFQNNPGYILYITSALSRYVMMGYYSEWSGYGTTRMESPTQRKLEYFPLSWEQIGYPGPSLGYRALRVNNSMGEQ
jgi:hypothetical protein